MSTFSGYGNNNRIFTHNGFTYNIDMYHSGTERIDPTLQAVRQPQAVSMQNQKKDNLGIYFHNH